MRKKTPTHHSIRCDVHLVDKQRGKEENLINRGAYHHMPHTKFLLSSDEMLLTVEKDDWKRKSK